MGSCRPTWSEGRGLSARLDEHRMLQTVLGAYPQGCQAGIGNVLTTAELGH
jgi:hypothetical protein